MGKLTFSIWETYPGKPEPTVSFPIEIHPETDLMSLEQAEQALTDLEVIIAEVREARERIVRVRYATGGVSYSYRDPSGLLQIGDLVEVPVQYGTKVGTVIAFGRDGRYDGPVKDVAAKLERRELS